MRDLTHNGPQEPFKFHGKAGEYFGIWIVNLLLTIVTLGIYSAWAKVRTKQYFARNTEVAGRSFDYHATGMQIFIGRLIVIGGFILFALLSAIPVIGILLVIALIVLMPYLIMRSIRFNAIMHSWSNVRFGFDGQTMGAFLSFLLYPFLAALTLYTTMPFASRAANRYVINNHRLGSTQFTFDSDIGPFYKAFLAALAWFLVVLAVMFFLVSSQIGSISNLQYMPEQTMVMIMLVLVYGTLLIGGIPAAIIYQAIIRNHIYGHTTLGENHQFRSTITVGKLLWIALSNAAVIVLTLGLMVPWAQVRMAKYLADNTTLLPDGSLDAFVGTIEADQGAIGDAYTDLEGIDVGIGL